MGHLKYTLFNNYNFFYNIFSLKLKKAIPLQLKIGVAVPTVRGKATSTRQGNLEWWGSMIKSPYDQAVANTDLSVVLGFNGSDIRDHYVPCFK